MIVPGICGNALTSFDPVIERLFQLVPWNAWENRQNFTFPFLVITYIDALQFCFKRPKKEKSAIVRPAE
jgi:hypothetical protein